MLQTEQNERQPSLTGISVEIKPSVKFQCEDLNSSAKLNKSKSLKKQQSLSSTYMSKALLELEDDFEATLDKAWLKLLKDPRQRTKNDHNCIYEIVSQLEVFSQYIQEGYKDILKKVSSKLIGKYVNKNEVVLSQNQDIDHLYIVLQGCVSIYDNSTVNRNEIQKTQKIKRVQNGQCINVSHLVFQVPFTGIAIADQDTLLMKLDQRIFKKYLQTQEEEKIENEISFFQSTQIFQSLSREQIQDLILNYSSEPLLENQILFHKNSNSNYFYIVKNGKIGVIQLFYKIKFCNFVGELKESNYTLLIKNINFQIIINKNSQIFQLYFSPTIQYQRQKIENHFNQNIIKLNIQIFQENEGAKKQKIQRQIKFLEEKDKVSYDLPQMNKQYSKQSQSDEKEEDRKHQVLKPQSTIFQIHTADFYSSIKSTHTKTLEYTTLDIFGFEEILANKRRSNVALSLAEDTIVYAIRSSYLIKKIKYQIQILNQQLFKIQSVNKVIISRQFTENLQKKSLSSLSIKFEQNLNIGLKLIEKQQTSQNKNNIEKEFNSVFNDKRNTDSKLLYSRGGIKSSSSLQSSLTQLSPLKKCIIKKQEMSSQNSLEKSSQIFSNKPELQFHSQSTVFDSQRYINRQQDKIDAVLRRQKIQTLQTVMDQNNIVSLQEENINENLKNGINQNEYSVRIVSLQTEGQQRKNDQLSDQYGVKRTQNKTMNDLETNQDYASLGHAQSMKSLSQVYNNTGIQSPKFYLSHKYQSPNQNNSPIELMQLKQNNILNAFGKSNAKLIEKLSMQNSQVSTPLSSISTSFSKSQLPNFYQQNQPMSPLPYRSQNNKILSLKILNLKKA